MNPSLSPYNSLPEAFFAKVGKDSDQIVYYYFDADTGEKRARTYAQVSERIGKMSSFLTRLGVSKGTPVAILSNSRPEWSEADLSILFAAGHTVSVYPSLTSSEIGAILNDSGARIVFAENQEQVAKLRSLTAGPVEVPGVADPVTLVIDAIVTFEDVPATGDDLYALSTVLQADPVPLTVPATASSEIAALVYTSGTTGVPKGVIQTHGNHLTNVVQASESGVFGEQGVLFLYLPLAHSFARLVQWLGFLTSATILYTRVADRTRSTIDLSKVSIDMHGGGAEFVPSVPRLFEKIRTQIMHLAAGKGMAQRALRLCLWASTEHYRNPKGCGLLATIAYKGTDVVRRSLTKKLFGPKFVHAISGGAKLPADVFEFFAALDIQILEGYGLTETCVATHVNRPGHARSGTVGTAFRGVETKIEADGEVCLRGPNITQGYYNKPEETAAAWDSEGWFHTGDLGSIDADGYLSITGRKKDLLVTAGGKKIAPQKIESLLQSNPLISHAVLVGEGKPYCSALVALHGPMVAKLAKAKGAPIGMMDDPPMWLVAEVQAHVDSCNKGLASFERVKKFAILPCEPSIENGLLTPTLKIKRAQVAKVYGDTIQGLYTGVQKE